MINASSDNKTLTLPFKHKGIHHCETALIGCIDFRIWPAVLEYVTQVLKLETGNFDFLNWPGATQPINEYHDDNDFVKSCLAVPYGLHEVKKIVIANHRDCGAYKGSARFDHNRELEKQFHLKELYQAKTKIMENYPGLEVILIYVDIDNEEMNFSISEVTNLYQQAT